MILDADLTVPPEDFPTYDAIADGKGEFINGTRLVYPMKSSDEISELFSQQNVLIDFSWLLNQRFTDTLCGTKVISRVHYNLLAENRNYFGILILLVILILFLVHQNLT